MFLYVASKTSNRLNTRCVATRLSDNAHRILAFAAWVDCVTLRSSLISSRFHKRFCQLNFNFFVGKGNDKAASVSDSQNNVIKSTAVTLSCRPRSLRHTGLTCDAK